MARRPWSIGDKMSRLIMFFKNKKFVFVDVFVIGIIAVLLKITGSQIEKHRDLQMIATLQKIYEISMDESVDEFYWYDYVPEDVCCMPCDDMAKDSIVLSDKLYRSICEE